MRIPSWYLSLSVSADPLRLPAIDDPNTGITIWESGAIIEYLVETYDKDSRLTFTTVPEKYHAKQFLHFQMSGQGPYFGQAVWFSEWHSEKLPSAIDRYRNEAKRVTRVLDKVLKGNGDGYLVGGKCTCMYLLTPNCLFPVVSGIARHVLRSFTPETCHSPTLIRDPKC